MTHAGEKENSGRTPMMDDAKLRELALKATDGYEDVISERIFGSDIRVRNYMNFRVAANPVEILARLDEKERLLERIAQLRKGLEWSAGSECQRTYKHDGNPPCGVANEKGLRIYCHPCYARETLAADDAAAAKSEVGR